MAGWVGLISAVVVVGFAALVSPKVERQSNRRLRLDAAMRAGRSARARSERARRSGGVCVRAVGV